MNRRMIEIPKEYDTLQKKVDYIDILKERQKKLDNMDMLYSYRLYITKEYYKSQLKNSL